MDYSVQNDEVTGRAL